MLRCPADPMVAALFASERLPRLIHQLRESYDCVIMDGPPLLGVAESRLLAMVADRVLFVVKWGSTRREVARNALSRLGNPDGFEGERVAKPVAVLTQVDLNKHARYRYGDVGESMAEYNRHYRSARGSDRGDRPIKQKMAAAANGVPLSWRRDENDKSFR
jgi:polysaccharide biosynthesis transport protein